jgi:hypothetical protein
MTWSTLVYMRSQAEVSVMQLSQGSHELAAIGLPIKTADRRHYGVLPRQLERFADTVPGLTSVKL